MKYKLCGMYIRKKKKQQNATFNIILNHRQYNTTSKVFCAIDYLFC